MFLLHLPDFSFCLLFLKFTLPLAFSHGQWPITPIPGGGTESKHGGPKCLVIPHNFTLCHGMQYTSMRLPNLLDHDTLDEAIQQGSAWVSLLRLHCHPNTKLFLCSLFAPLCLPLTLDRPIQPCQSLCREVEQGCADRMAQYGFPWPAMLNCSQFPADHELCLGPPPPHSAEEQSGEPEKPFRKKNSNNAPCKACSQVATFENLMDNFCRSSIVLKVGLRPFNSSHVAVARVSRVFKGKVPGGGGAEQQLIRMAEPGERRCQCAEAQRKGEKGGRNNFLVMAAEERAVGPGMVAKLIMAWKQEKSFKRAIRRFKKVNCSTLGREIRESVLSQMFRRNSERT